MRTSSRDNLCKAPRRFSRFFQYTFAKVEAIFRKVKSIGDDISLRIKMSRILTKLKKKRNIINIIDSYFLISVCVKYILEHLNKKIWKWANKSQA